MPGQNSLRILVGVTGSIAAYRAVELIRQLSKLGYEIRVVMSRGATKFVSALTFEALSKHPVLLDPFAAEEGQISHVEYAYWADAMIVAPCTAHTLAKLALGLADDALTTTVLSVAGPVVVAPAMETRMFMHPATQKSIATLQARGTHIIGPDDGPLASGRTGKGRLSEIEAIVAGLQSALASPNERKTDLLGKSVVITAGPTVEDIDPVRYLSNRSSGKMGFALAVAAAQRGAEVELIHGPTSIPVPTHPQIRPIPARSASDMHDAVMSTLARVRADVILMAAAVADYTPKTSAPAKIKKADGPLDMELVRTKDILADVGAKSHGAVLIGFAAETENVAANARKKLNKKQADMICANLVGTGEVFGSDENHIQIFAKDGSMRDLGTTSKAVMAHRILDVAAESL